MARMHSGSRGKSRSRKPTGDEVPSWTRYKADEVEELVVKLAKEGHSTSEIGIQLRDVYGIPDVKKITEKSISQILEEKDLLPDIPEDLFNLLKKRIAIEDHLEENAKDMTAKRGLQLTDAKIMRLANYYKDNERLPQEWKYDAQKVRLLIE